MRKLLVSEFMSLDGVIQAPGGMDEDRDGGFAHGGWTVPYWHDDIGAAFGALMKDVGAFLLGRRTYVVHAQAFEPMPPGDPFGAASGALDVRDTNVWCDVQRNDILLRVADVVVVVHGLALSDDAVLDCRSRGLVTDQELGDVDRDRGRSGGNVDRLHVAEMPAVGDRRRVAAATGGRDNPQHRQK